MTPRQFFNITKDIEKNLGGDGYQISVSLSNGGSVSDVSWKAITYDRSELHCPETIRLEKDDHPPFYVSVSDIVVVKLCS